MKKLFYVVNDDWFFTLHRVPTLRAAQKAGFDVALVTRVGQQRKAIEKLGVRVIDFPFDRRSRNPFAAVMQIMKLAALYRRERPDIVHHIALKPILFGFIAAWFARVPHVVNGFVGLGTVFYGNIFLARILRSVVFPALFLAAHCKNVWTLFENQDDLNRMLAGKMACSERSFVVPGSGVDVDRYQASLLPETQEFICMFAGRLIAMKGLQAIRDAFEILKGEPNFYLWICGMPDPGNPESWTEGQILQWCNENTHVIWKKHQPDMAQIWPQAHVALQPTIGGEGLPVSLLEAAACARPLIATDVPGCRNIVVDGVNGLLIPQNDPEKLADAIRILEKDRERCRAMGLEARRHVVSRFSSSHVTEAIFALYQKLEQVQA